MLHKEPFTTDFPSKLNHFTLNSLDQNHISCFFLSLFLLRTFPAELSRNLSGPRVFSLKTIMRFNQIGQTWKTEDKRSHSEIRPDLGLVTEPSTSHSGANQSRYVHLSGTESSNNDKTSAGGTISGFWERAGVLAALRSTAAVRISIQLRFQLGGGWKEPAKGLWFYRKAELLRAPFVLCMWTPYVPLVAGVTTWPLTPAQHFCKCGWICIVHSEAGV